MYQVSDNDYKWSDEDEQHQILQIRRNIPQIILEEQKIKDNQFIEKKLENNTIDEQKQKKEEKKEISITKSDIQDIKHLLENIVSGIKEMEGFKTYLYEEKSREATERGRTHIYKYRNYYDITNTIKIAGPDNPNDFDSPIYNKERIFEDLERYADIVNVANDGTDTLFAIISHGGRTNFSQEAPIFPGEVKTYYNVYELRLRSSTKGLQYRVTEYDIMDVSESPLIPTEMAVLQDEPLPDIDTNWLTLDLTPLRTPTTFRIQVAVSIEGILSTVITREGNEQVIFFNATSGPTLLADGLYVFEMLVHKSDSVNFRYSETGGTIRILRVQEIDSATA